MSALRPHYLAGRQLELHLHGRVIQEFVQSLKSIVNAFVSDGVCDGWCRSLKNGNKCGGIEGSAVAIVVPELHDATSVVQREDVRAIGKMIAITDVTKRQPHAAEHSESVGMLRTHAFGHGKTIDERGQTAAVAATDAVKDLQPRDVLIISAVGVRRNVQVGVPERVRMRQRNIKKNNCRRCAHARSSIALSA